MWNALPIDIRSMVSVGAFEKQLKTHLFKLAFVSPCAVCLYFLCVFKVCFFIICFSLFFLWSYFNSKENSIVKHFVTLLY